MSSTLYAYLYGDSAKQSQITKHLTTEQSLSHFSYDVNGRLSNQVEDGTNLPKSFVYNAAGELLQRSTTASTKHFFYADGQRIGDVGNAPDENPRISYAEQLVRNWGGDTPEARRTRYSNPGPLRADFDQNYEPLNDSYAGSSLSSYVVRQNGETLRAIAQALWGDGSLWYLIAEANGLLGDGGLVAGQVLLIPNKVTNIHNNSTTWRPYSAGEAMGSVDPNWTAANMAAVASLGEAIRRSIAASMSILATSNMMRDYTFMMAEGINPALATGQFRTWRPSYTEGSDDLFGFDGLRNELAPPLRGVVLTGSDNSGSSGSAAAQYWSNVIAQSIDWSDVGHVALADDFWPAGTVASTQMDEGNVFGSGWNAGYSNYSELTSNATDGVAVGGIWVSDWSWRDSAAGVFGSALGDAVVGSIAKGDGQNASKPLTQAEIDYFLEGTDTPLSPVYGKTFGEDRAARTRMNTPDWAVASGGDGGMTYASDFPEDAPSGPRTYKVSKGDGLERIARAQYGDNWRAGVAALASANNITQTDRYGNPVVRMGAELIVPDLDGLGADAMGRLGRAGGSVIAANSRQSSAVRAADAAAAAQGATLLAADGMRMGPTIERAKALGIYSGDVGAGLSVSNAPMVELRRSPGASMTAWNGDSGISAQQLATIRGSWHHQQSANLSEALADVAIGEGAGMVLRATGRAASATARAFGPTLDNMAFNAMDRLGLVMRVVPDGPGATGGMGANGAFNAVKRDLGIPRVQQPEAVKLVPMTDSNGQRILNASRQPIMTREYTYTRADGSRVVIQNHSAGHQFGQGGVGDQRAHFNVRPIENTRTGKVPGTLDHYPF